MKKMILLSALILASNLLTGCIGLVVDHPREKSTTQICLGNRGNLTNGPAATAPLTEAKVLELWGKPDTIRTNSDHLTVWHYRGDRNWSFIMPAYLVGLPIPVWSGHDHVDLYFKDGNVQKASSNVEVVSGAMLGMVNVIACEKEPRGDEINGVLIGYGFAESKAPSSHPAVSVNNPTNSVTAVASDKVETVAVVRSPNP